MQPPKRGRPKASAKARPTKRPRNSTLPSTSEADIHEAFALFAQPDLDDFPDEEEGVITHADAKEALRSVISGPYSSLTRSLIRTCN